MLNFFRNYQRFFFLIITVVIVISFSFFGVMNVMNETPIEDPVAFEAVDGAKIKRSELEKLALFISSDSYDKLLYGGVWGPNFLNDGVIQKNFLQTGLAQVLAEEYPTLLEGTLLNKSKKEKSYTLYHHPQADFISVENAWGYLAPEMKNYYHTVVNGDEPLQKEVFDARVNLYLGQRRVSPQSIKQVLAYQKRQYSWLQEDPNLYRADLSVFGYHSVDDWFGPEFTRLVSSVIINMAKIAEEKGYEVSDAEAYADLMRNAQMSYLQNESSPYMDAISVEGYLSEQLRRMNLDTRGATRIWRQVLLFRRLFESYGNSLLVARETFAPFAKYAGATAEGDLYSLQEPMRLSSFTDLQLFQVYLDAVAKRGADKASMPRTFKSAEQVAKVTPELVERNYKIDVATFDLGKIQQRIPLDKMWEWQISDNGWNLLQDKYSIIAVKKSNTSEERFKALESLDPSTRDQLDRTSRELMAKEDKDALNEGIESAPSEVRTVAIRLAGDSPLKGVADSKKLIALMEKSLQDNAEGKKAQKQLEKYTQDGRYYFKIKVLSREPEQEILTFQDAKRSQVLIKLLNKKLEAHYAELKKKDAGKYRSDEGEFKPFADVRMQIARSLFAPVLKNLEKAHKGGYEMTVEDAATLRLKEYVEKVRDAAVSEANLEGLVASSDIEPDFKTQFALIKESHSLNRSEKNSSRALAETAFELEEGSWTEVNAPANGDLNFFQVKARGSDSFEGALISIANQVQEEVAFEGQRLLLKELLSSMRERQEIELDYLTTKSRAHEPR